MKTMNLLKRPLLLVALIISILFVTNSCQNNPKGNGIADPIVPKDKLIKTDTAKKYIAKYKSLKYEAISEATGKLDALEFYYTIAELEGYLAYVKSEAKKQNVSVNGLAISLAAYPEKTTKEGYGNLTTIILRPYGTRNGVSYLVTPKGTEIIETISPMNDATSSPPLD